MAETNPGTGQPETSEPVQATDQRENASPDGPKSFRSLTNRINWTKYAMVLVLVVMSIAFHFMTNGIFISPRNLSTLMRQVAVLGVIASGMVMLLIPGQIDLSAGSSLYLVSVVAAAMIVQVKLSLIPALAIAVAAGLALGLWQGFWVSRFRVPAFIVTLAGMLAWRGLGLVHSKGATIGPVGKEFQAISNAFVPKTTSYLALVAVFVVYVMLTVLKYASARNSKTAVSSGWLRPVFVRVIPTALVIGFFAWAVVSYQGIPMAVVVLAGVIVLLTFIQNRTVFGRNLYAIGSNRQAAALAGINIERHLLFGFALMGLMYAVAGVLSVARLSGAVATGGQNLELDAIASAVIGGTSLSGGIGTVPGAIIGALVLSVVDNGMSLMNVSVFWQMFVKAQLLLMAVLFDVLSTRKRRI